MRVYVTDAYGESPNFPRIWKPRYMLYPNGVSFNDLYDDILDTYAKEYAETHNGDDPIDKEFFRGIVFCRGEDGVDLIVTIYNDYLE